MLKGKNLFYLLALCFFIFSCSPAGDRRFTLHKTPPIADADVSVEMSGFYYGKANGFDVLMILFEDGKVYFHPYISPTEPDSSLKYYLENNNSTIRGTVDWWGNFNIVKNKISIEYIYEDKPYRIYNTIDVSGIVVDNETITISKIYCDRFKNKPCKKIGYREFNPPLTLKFIPREFYIQKGRFYEKEWYKKDAWNSNENN